VSRPQRVLVTGGNGQLGRDVRDVLAGAVPDGGVPDGELEGTLLPPVEPGSFEITLGPSSSEGQVVKLTVSG